MCLRRSAILSLFVHIWEEKYNCLLSVLLLGGVGRILMCYCGFFVKIVILTIFCSFYYAAPIIYLSKQMNLSVRDCMWRLEFEKTVSKAAVLFFFNILEMWLPFFVDFIVFVVLECCREFFNKIYRKFHGPRHVRGLVFRFRTHHPGTLSSKSYDFPVSHLETEI